MEGLNLQVNLKSQHIREVFAYIKTFKNNTFVFHIDDALLSSPSLHRIIKDILYLLDVGIKVLIIAGARNTINEIFNRYNHTITFKDNKRMLTSEDMELVQMASFDTAVQLLNAFAKYKQATIIGNWIVARGIGVCNGVDFQHVGTVKSLQTEPIEILLQDKVIPIFPAIGWSIAGNPYSLEAVELSAKISSMMNANKLFYVLPQSPNKFIEEMNEGNKIDLEGNEDGKVLRIKTDEAIQLLEQNKNTDAIFSYYLLQNSIYALTHGLDRVHLVDGREDGCLLEEMFSYMGTGLMLYNDEYQAIEPLQENEVEEVWDIMYPLIVTGILAERSIEDIYNLYQDYICYKVDGSIYGVAALHKLEDNCAEIAGVAVKGDYNRSGVGRRLITYLIEESKKQGFEKVFVLTTATGDWFESIGFEIVDMSHLPPSRQKKYNMQKRGSRIYCITIT